jgi:hypothetical protein
MKRFLLATVFCGILSSTNANADQWDGTWPPPEVIEWSDVGIGAAIAWWATTYNKANTPNRGPIHSVPVSNGLDTSRMHKEHQNYMQQQSRLDQEVKSVLAGFPHRAFDVTMRNATYNIQNRDYVVDVNFEVAWNQNYVSQLAGVLEQTSGTHNPTHYAKLVTQKHWTTPGNDYHFDRTRGELLMHTLYRAGPQVKVYAGNQSMGCWDIPELSGLEQVQHKMVQTAGNGVVLNTWLKLKSSIRFPVQVPPDRVRLEVVNQNQCL